MRAIYFTLALIFLSTGLAFAETDSGVKANELNASFGFRTISDNEIIKYSNADKDAGAFLSVGYSRLIDQGIFIDFRVTGVGSGSSDQKTDTDGKKTDKTQWLIYVEPSIGLSYKYRYLFKFLVPFVELGGSYARAQLKNNVDYNVNETGSGFGGYAGLGLGIAIGDSEYSIGTRYTYLPVEFNEEIKGNISGADFYFKGSLTF